MKSKRKDEYYVYMVRCKGGSLYTGSTNDVETRVRVHNEGKGAKYTRSRRPVELVYVEKCAFRNDALKRECGIKKLSRREKEELTSGRVK